MKRFVIMIVAVVAVSVLWMGGWFYIAGQIRAEIGYLAQADGVTQPRLVCDRLDIGGAPFSFSPRCTDARITSGDVTVELAAITGTALFYTPTHIQLFATGPARIADAFTGATQEVRWSNLHASLRLDDGMIERFSALADDLVYADMLIGETVIGTAAHGEIHLLDATPADSPPGTGAIFDAYVTLEDVTSQTNDIANGRLVVDARLSGLPDPALWGDPQVLGFWQALGGELALRSIEASADGLSLTAQGAASLTDAGLVNGNLEIASQGVADRIATLVGDPSVARIVLGSPGEDGVSHQTLQVSDGTVVVGIIPVASLPPLF
ncbi:DUF2125 domain-containing protein [Pelagibacterium halotolerans]|uniref:DUF2125 domain-containing protein n=1 Tax=Pelagibacterium halotolerans (strain DSM 22347 / JCM 15775 / CGMCC 1.7692 / B2) TaxID=1082931 RepID=G4RF13_PELHB|nr:DUF2125 domain-containing protein [Pelagibacterium halotolerans]AEQ52946.1 conserved hypothetical protein [Pelagibacterium halotolerans B2]QJR17388.1 DUF2125 domain-containing protein [Pelagibacterium halotolerans]SEA73072.1 hypothetical protein SAMN05428936_10710 [Pelagibacterium halotolerans]